MKRIIAVISIAMFILGMSACKKKETVIINNASDLAGKKIGCQAGTTGELYIQESVKDAKIKSFKTGIDASLDLKNGAIDAIVLDELPAKEIVKRNPDLVIVNDDFMSESYAIAVKKGNTELLESINKTIADLKMNGTYENLIKSFMPVDGNIVIPEIEDIESKDMIKMGTNASFPPFEFIMGTEIVGFDAAIGKLISKDCGKKLKIVDMAFDGLIAALQSGAIDFIAAGMTATEERRQNVDFSESYYESNQVIIVRKTVE
ncbi:MAG: transporter substrate-binding domain-containing protein [Spirochaetales bacterium]|nr:transporter substrate-binding domain-containing protein [Spirochaetales bacterium]